MICDWHKKFLSEKHWESQWVGSICIAGECDRKKYTRYCCESGVSLKPEKVAQQMIIGSFSVSVDGADYVKLAAIEIIEEILLAQCLRLYYNE